MRRSRRGRTQSAEREELTAGGGDMVDFANLAQIFLENGVFLEIAVPTILRCLMDTVEVMDGHMTWYVKPYMLHLINIHEQTKHAVGISQTHKSQSNSPPVAMHCRLCMTRGV